MDTIFVRPHPPAVEALVPVIRFFFPSVLDPGGRQVHRDVDTRPEHGLGSAEPTLPYRVFFDLRHGVLDALAVVVDPRVDCHHRPVKYLSSRQYIPCEHTEAPDKRTNKNQRTKKMIHVLEYLPIINTITTPEFPTFQWMFMPGFFVNYIVWNGSLVHAGIVADPSEEIDCDLRRRAEIQ